MQYCFYRTSIKNVYVEKNISNSISQWFIPLNLSKSSLEAATNSMVDSHQLYRSCSILKSTHAAAYRQLWDPISHTYDIQYSMYAHLCWNQSLINWLWIHNLQKMNARDTDEQASQEEIWTQIHDNQSQRLELKLIKHSTCIKHTVYTVHCAPLCVYCSIRVVGPSNMGDSRLQH